MKDKLLSFYKNEVSVEALVLSHMRGLSRFFNISFWISFSSFILVFLSLLLLVYVKIIGPFYVFILLFVISFICLLVSIDLYVRRAKEIVRREVKTPSYEKRWRWRTEEFNEYQRQKVTDFLNEKNLLKKWKVENIIESLNDDNERMRVPPLIAPAVFISLTVPNVNQFLTFIYENNEKNKITVFVYSFLITSFMVFVINYLSKQVWEMKEEFLKEFYHRRELLNILEDVLLSIEE
ncbi:hypothetical protein [Paenibacillus odorifer]|uniref:Uncharacterized protein n=1 Tax=Paenibacillus odorifer TaxID=189426 RepID=A0AAD0KL06_9BACL|nr:hypothetical protein [Paenibacillus odorifer]AWV35139.1 hypothetical protein CD191_22265 [Paenibacillus odorifer]